MSRKSKRVLEPVRPVIENLQPRLLLSSDVTDPGTVAPPPPELPSWMLDYTPGPTTAIPAGAGPSVGGVVSGRLYNAFEGLFVRVYGTDGDDTIVVTSGPAQGEIRISGVAGVPDGTVFSGVRHVEIQGGKGNDHITADFGAIPGGVMYGGDGDDVLIATGPVNEIYGGQGNDLIQGSPTYQKLDGGPGNDTIDGGGGGDLLFVGGTTPPVPPIPYMPRESWIALFGGVTSGVVVRMDLGWVPNDGFGGQDVISNIRDVQVASYLDDVVYGDSQDNRILCGDGGSDTIYGGGGNDFISIDPTLNPAGGQSSGLLAGGEGDDTLFTRSDAVIMDGGPGRNTYQYDIPGQTPTTIVSGETEGPQESASAPAAAMAAPRAQVSPAQAAKKARLAAKIKAAKLKAAKLKARLARLAHDGGTIPRLCEMR